MSYDIYIGEPRMESYVDEDYDELDCSWVIDYKIDNNAPKFEGDIMTKNSNRRHPGYSQWADFLRRNRLYDLFFNEERGIMRKHPGCFKLTKEHLAEFKKSLENREKIDKRPAGLDPRYMKDDMIQIPKEEETHDYDKVRLIWLIWWTEWALQNCKIPAIYNR